jgi:hypothetical protein
MAFFCGPGLLSTMLHCLPSVLVSLPNDFIGSVVVNLTAGTHLLRRRPKDFQQKQAAQAAQLQAAQQQAAAQRGVMA